MKVLVGCERSGIVREAFRAKGHAAFSCDLVAADDESGWHFIDDVNRVVVSHDWDLIILHPPCTYLAVSGNRYYADSILRQNAIRWTRTLWSFALNHSDRVALENPVGVLSTAWRKPDQYIQPYMFGHPESKKTGLWLHGLPKLVATNLLAMPEQGYWENQTPSGQNKLGPSEDKAKIRSQTYQGIADAMAEQWG